MSVAYVRAQSEPDRPAPQSSAGPVAFLRERLFSGAGTTLFTLLGLAFLAWVLPPLARFLFIDAIWDAPNGEACRAPGAGACWAYIWRKAGYFAYGSYPLAERWRVDVVFILGAVLIAWLLVRRAPLRNLAAGLFFVVYPVVAFFLLRGTPALGLPVVTTDLWGGILVTLIMALSGIVFSLPFGVALALGRRSSLPIVRFFSIGFIEIMRGVPMITVLFMANLMLPLFVPDSWSPDRLLRPLVGVALFASAYMAEVVRGGLQAIPKGQFEGAMALGLTYPQRMRLIVLPQALTIVIPGIVNSFIALFKDTTLVAIVGIFDFLRTVDTARLDPEWAGPTITATGYVFAALFYFMFCFGMSRYSIAVEKDLSRGRTR
ncbi:MAG: amino acid ABC transporter permease [Methylobacteriaceae bacterium]|nr:amino acid ABC transporter permease [Methylobacteriaceae bacterium]